MDFTIDTLSFPLAFPNDTNTGVMHHCHGFSGNVDKVSACLERGFIGLVFNLQDDLHFEFSESNAGTLPRRQYCLAYIPTGAINLSVEQGKYAAFCIEFTPYYVKRIRDHFPTLTEFLKKAEAQPSSLLDAPRPITPTAWQEINMILIDKDSTDEIRKFLLGPKYVTISMDCLKHLDSFGSLGTPEIEKIRKAHDYIQKNFRFRCRVAQIADIVKMNAKQLEKGFKVVYGKTVYKFLTGERMSRATALLRDTNMTVKEIAVAVGYKNAKTFSHIFKNHFAYPPGKLQKKPVDD